MSGACPWVFSRSITVTYAAAGRPHRYRKPVAPRHLRTPSRSVARVLQYTICQCFSTSVLPTLRLCCHRQCSTQTCHQTRPKLYHISHWEVIASQNATSLPDHVGSLNNASDSPLMSFVYRRAPTFSASLPV